MEKLCKKCHNTSSIQTLDQTTACPHCGAIYAKVDAALSKPSQPSAEIPPRAKSSTPTRLGRLTKRFLSYYREDKAVRAEQAFIAECEAGYIVRTYSGKTQAEAVKLAAADFTKLAGAGLERDSQTWQEGRKSFASKLLITLLFAGLFIVVSWVAAVIVGLLYVVFSKPHGVLTVVYRPSNMATKVTGLH